MRSGHPVPQNAHRFSHEAMATVFELAMIHDDAGYAHQCAQAAFAEVDRLEQELSMFLPNSDVSRINNSEPGAAVVVGADTFTCLERCECLALETNGAFDVTMGLMPHLLLYDVSYSVLRLSDRLAVDLGGFGKGYAVDRVAEILSEWDIPRALIHSGSSSVLAMEAPPGEPGWQMTLRDPSVRERVLQRLCLEHRAVNGSGLQKGNHILDPRTGHPVEGRRAAWVITGDAATGDALSTAFVVMSLDEIQEYCHEHEAIQAVVITERPGGGEEILRCGDLADEDAEHEGPAGHLP